MKEDKNYRTNRAGILGVIMRIFVALVTFLAVLTLAFLIYAYNDTSGRDVSVIILILLAPLAGYFMFWICR